MSAEFVTEPRLTYDQVRASRRLTFEPLARDVYAGRRQVAVKAGARRGLVLSERDGRAVLERFGDGDLGVLAVVAAEFDVRVYDEHGLHLEDASSDTARRETI